MIFQNSNKKDAQADPVVATPNEAMVGQTVPSDQNDQSDQELAQVLADIDSQVNANNDILSELQEATDQAEMVESDEAKASTNNVSFEKVADELDSAENLEAMSSFQPADLTSVEEEDQSASNNVKSESAAENHKTAPFYGFSTSESSNVSMETEDNLTAKYSTEKSDLDELRKKALSDLRPIVDKVELKDDEAFDVLLLLIRETDDESLLPRAYEAARKINDEARRAQALLDVIKEADYFKNKA